MATIILHKNLDDLLRLSINIIRKHQTDGNKSPLTKIELEQLNRIIKEVHPKYQLLLETRKKANELNEEIQFLLGIHRSEKKIVPGTARFILAQSRDILKGIYREDLTKLHEWGFEVIVKERRNKKIRKTIEELNGHVHQV